ncbi:hypothetical protein EAH87_00690 [Sphingomonas koreensis]|nr:hypothetical protein EAH87_00690 [Sphingomonas koreensis]
MKLDWAGVFADAWRRFRRDRQMLLPLAGLFLFLPQFAFYLLAQPLPKLPADAAADAGALLAPGSPLVEWMTRNAPGMLATVLLMAFGALAVLIVYLGGERPTIGTALRRAIGLFPRYLLAAIVAGVPSAPVQLGMLILAIPCLYVLGRLMLVGPAIVAEAPIGVGGAITRSFALTKGRGLMMMGFAALALVAGMLAPAPFRLVRDSLQAAQMVNPVAVAIVEAIGSGLAAAVALGVVLVEIALYRRLSGSSNGM